MTSHPNKKRRQSVAASVTKRTPSEQIIYLDRNGYHAMKERKRLAKIV